MYFIQYSRNFMINDWLKSPVQISHPSKSGLVRNKQIASFFTFGTKVQPQC